MISKADLFMMQERLARERRRGFHECNQEVPKDAAEQEVGKGGLQSQIINWCESQLPRWVYDFPRTDLRSTLPLGRHDSTIWGPFPKCFVIETKAKGKKRTIDQLSWAARLAALKWEVRVVYSLEEFKAIVEA